MVRWLSTLGIWLFGLVALAGIGRLVMYAQDANKPKTALTALPPATVARELTAEEKAQIRRESDERAKHPVTVYMAVPEQEKEQPMPLQASSGQNPSAAASTSSDGARDSGSSYRAPRRKADGAPKSVSVRGYTRKDGTYVAPHTRRAARSR